MLIDGEKWACEACVRGHRVTTCKHHDRPLIHINRKGRPFATCSVCNCTPCEAPEDHAKLKREAEAKCQSSKRAAGRSPRSTSVGSLKPIAPRPAPSTGGSGAEASRVSHSPPSHGAAAAAAVRPRATISSSPPSQLYHQQQQGLMPSATSPNGDSPLYLPLHSSGSYASPPYCTMVDMPTSLSMVNPLDEPGLFEPGVSFAESAAAIYALEDLDVNSLPADVFQGDWSWLSDEAVLRDTV
ncbi:putative Cu-dependent DNA-binding protein [Aspergillus homomorphus CBS 101889]|uniref:Copper-fist-domain-containing protein n=1 Tax=Aspergillus homomorphus (strain CBS 101889) TaxID=1450537 RepID=A0A395I320_ASPHC|nr:copper-fist-domain-containing protein [Aspergillus homomorphus CBS 101889]RAL14347.1 copper-fist-domain-containing protein [Aspergillus homomorphus CBS 101889]